MPVISCYHNCNYASQEANCTHWARRCISSILLKEVAKSKTWTIQNVEQGHFSRLHSKLEQCWWIWTPTMYFCHVKLINSCQWVMRFFRGSLVLFLTSLSGTMQSTYPSTYQLIIKHCKNSNTSDCPNKPEWEYWQKTNRPVKENTKADVTFGINAPLQHTGGDYRVRSTSIFFWKQSLDSCQHASHGRKKWFEIKWEQIEDSKLKEPWVRELLSHQICQDKYQ